MTYKKWHDYSDEVCEIEPDNMIPLKLAINKLRMQLGWRTRSDTTIRVCLLEHYSDVLKIEKRGFFYYCSKDRVMFIDFRRYHAKTRFP